RLRLADGRRCEAALQARAALYIRGRPRRRRGLLRQMNDRRFAVLLALIVAVTAARIATTYRVFSQTADEPYHLAAGYDFLRTGRQPSDPQHPPLARVLFALPFVSTPPPSATDGLARGNALLLRDDRYTQN